MIKSRKHSGTCRDKSYSKRNPKRKLQKNFQTSTEGKIWFPGCSSLLFGYTSINHIIEIVLSSCATSSGIYFISHKSQAFNNKLNEKLF